MPRLLKTLSQYAVERKKEETYFMVFNTVYNDEYAFGNEQNSAEYETILDECSEAIKLTKNEIQEFVKKYPKQKIFLDSLIECWSENL